MFDSILKNLIVALRAIIKAVTGFIIVPIGIVVTEVMPRWREAPRAIRWVTGIVVLPLYLFSRVAGPWWEGFDITD